MSVKFSIEMRTTALLSHAKFCPIGEGVRKGSREDITKSVKFLGFWFPRVTQVNSAS